MSLKLFVRAEPLASFWKSSNRFLLLPKQPSLINTNLLSLKDFYCYIARYFLWIIAKNKYYSLSYRIYNLWKTLV
jgi:hypothetical protein